MQHDARAIERDDAAGNGLDDGLKLAAALLDGLVGGGELRRGALGQLAAGLKIGGHVIEGADQVAHFAGGDGGDAVVVFAGGNFVHGDAERFNGPRDLLGQKHGQPQAGKEDEHRDEQLHEEEDGADAVAGAEELPVGGCAGADAGGGLAESLRHGQRGDHHLAGGGGGHAERILLARNFERRAHRCAAPRTAG